MTRLPVIDGLVKNPILHYLTGTRLPSVNNPEPQDELGVDDLSTHENGGLGVCVKITDRHLLAGAPNRYPLGTMPARDVGSVVAWKWNGVTWKRIGELMEGGPATFGYSVDISGDLAVIGAPWYYDTNISSPDGAIYLYHWTGYSWIQLKEFHGNFEGHQLGFDVAIESLAIAACGQGASPVRLFAYEYPDAPFLEERTPLPLSGEKVHIHNGYLAVAIPSSNEVRFFEPPALTADWASSLFFTLPVPTGVTGLGEGWLDFNDDWLAVGNLTDVFVYQRTGPLGWMYVQTITGDGAHGYGGYSLELSGDRLAIGSPFNDSLGVDGGMVEVWEWNGSAFVKTHAYFGPNADDRFGFGVSLNNHLLAVGSPGFDGPTYADVGRVDIIDSRYSVNYAPINLELSSTSAPELEDGVVVGTISATDVDGTVAYYDLANDPDNLFEIVTDTLKVQNGKQLDYSISTSHLVTIRAYDDDGDFVEETFTISVEIANTPPYNIQLSSTSAPELEDGVVVGTLSAQDDDGTIDHYEIAADPDNLFAISGNDLKVQDGKHLDYSVSTSHSVTIRAVDNQGGFADQPFTITVVENASPYAVQLSSTDAQPYFMGAGVGELTATDDDGSVSGFEITNDPSNIFRVIYSGGHFTLALQSDKYITSVDDPYSVSVRAFDDDGAYSGPVPFSITPEAGFSVSEKILDPAEHTTSYGLRYSNQSFGHRLAHGITETAGMGEWIAVIAGYYRDGVSPQYDSVLLYNYDDSAGFPVEPLSFHPFNSSLTNVALYNQRVAVVASWDTSGGFANAGRIWVADFNGTSFVQQSIVEDSNPRENGGIGNIALDVMNNTLAATKYTNTYPDTGALVWRWNGSAWLETSLAVSNPLGVTYLRNRYIAIGNYGDRVVVGMTDFAWGGSTDTTTGEVYVFDWNGSAWVESARITPSDGAVNDQFGSCLDVSENGNRIAVFSPGKSTIYVYDWNGSAWVETKLSSVNLSTSTTDLKLSLRMGNGLNGDKIIAPVLTSLGGIAVVFNFNGTSWSRVDVTAPAETSLSSSESAAISRTGNIFIGCPGDSLEDLHTETTVTGISAGRVFWSLDDTLNTSHAFIMPPNGYADCKFGSSFGVDSKSYGWVQGIPNDRLPFNGPDTRDRRTGSIEFRQTDLDVLRLNRHGYVFCPSDANDGGLFGHSVAMTYQESIPEDRYIAGGPLMYRTGTTNQVGRAYILHWSAVIAEIATEPLQPSHPHHLLEPSVFNGGMRFGWSVDIFNDRAVVGAPEFAGSSNAGRVFVFDWNGTAWVESAIITPSDGGVSDQFGTSVCLQSSDCIIVGAPGKNANAGAVYYYIWNGSSWVETRTTPVTPVGSGGVDGPRFGECVQTGLNLNTADSYFVAGAPGWNDHGAVYVFKWNGASWVEVQHIVAHDPVAGDHFGASCAIDFPQIVVGAPDKTVEGDAQAGATYLFSMTSWYSGGGWLLLPKFENRGYFVPLLNASSSRVEDRMGSCVQVWTGPVPQLHFYIASGAPSKETLELHADSGAIIFSQGAY